jgi:hypothetical protein
MKLTGARLKNMSGTEHQACEYVLKLIGAWVKNMSWIEYPSSCKNDLKLKREKLN